MCRRLVPNPALRGLSSPPLLLLLAPPCAHAFSWGAPICSSTDLIVIGGMRDREPRPDPSAARPSQNPMGNGGWTVTTSRPAYTPGGSVLVTLSGPTRVLRGFTLQANLGHADGAGVGAFATPPGTRYAPQGKCMGQKSFLTHSQTGTSRVLQVLWTAPAQGDGVGEQPVIFSSIAYDEGKAFYVATPVTVVAEVATGRLTSGMAASARFVQAITGRVFNDLDKNQRPDPNDVGLPGYVLQLWEDTDGSGIFNPPADTFLQNTTTDSNGNYTLRPQPSSQARRLFLRLLLKSNFRQTVTPASPVVIQDDPLVQSSLAQDWAVRNWTGTIRGRVVEVKNFPLESEFDEMALIGKNVTLISGSLVQITKTNQLGEFSFNNLPPGFHIINVSDSDPKITKAEEVKRKNGTVWTVELPADVSLQFDFFFHIFCGNNQVDRNRGETCDPPAPGVCRDDCTSISCGDGILDPGEECEAQPFVHGQGCYNCKVEKCFTDAECSKTGKVCHDDFCNKQNNIPYFCDVKPTSCALGFACDPTTGTCTPNGVVQGVVFWDADLNGQYNPLRRELPFFGATVVVSDSNSTLPPQKTNEQGLFRFTGLLPGGNYVISVLQQGLLAQYRPTGYNGSATVKFQLPPATGPGPANFSFGFTRGVLCALVFEDLNGNATRDLRMLSPDLSFQGQEPGVANVTGKLLVPVFRFPVEIPTTPNLLNRAPNEKVPYEIKSDAQGRLCWTDLPYDDTQYLVELSPAPPGRLTTQAAPPEQTVARPDVNISFGFQGVQKVSGEIWLDQNRDGVRQPGETGLQQLLSVCLQRQDFAALYCASTNNGKYTISQLSGALYRAFLNPAYLDAPGLEVTVRPDLVNLSGPNDASHVNFGVVRPQICGRVMRLLSNGVLRGLEGVPMALYTGNTQTNQLERINTNQTGRYCFQWQLLPGQYKVKVMEPPEQLTPVNPSGLVTVPPSNRDLDFVFEGSGCVEDEDCGAPGICEAAPRCINSECVLESKCPQGTTCDPRDGSCNTYTCADWWLCTQGTKPIADYNTRGCNSCAYSHCCEVPSCQLDQDCKPPSDPCKISTCRSNPTGFKACLDTPKCASSVGGPVLSCQNGECVPAVTLRAGPPEQAAATTTTTTTTTTTVAPKSTASSATTSTSTTTTTIQPKPAAASTTTTTTTSTTVAPTTQSAARKFWSFFGG